VSDSSKSDCGPVTRPRKEVSVIGATRRTASDAAPRFRAAFGQRHQVRTCVVPGMFTFHNETYVTATPAALFGYFLFQLDEYNGFDVRSPPSPGSAPQGALLKLMGSGLVGAGGLWT
jgi:hypothetical protein